MVTNYRDAYIETVDDLVDYNRSTDFVHNMADTLQALMDKGNSIRGYASQDAFWVIQIFAAYEWYTTSTNDPDGTSFNWYSGQAPGGPTGDQGPAMVFTEVVRDVIAGPQVTGWGAWVDLEVAMQRTAMHESLHHWGFAHGWYIPGSDIGIMSTETAYTGTPEQNKLNADQLRYVRIQTRPR